MIEPQDDDATLPNPQRDGLGRLLPGHTLPVKHGLFSERDLANLNAEMSVFLGGSITDDGGEGEVATRRRTLHEYRARLHRRIVQLDAAIETRGLFDPRGKLRVAWLGKLESLIAAARGIDNVLGLDRRARDVGSMQDYMRGKAGPRQVGDVVQDSPVEEGE
jgi:hypothetical protein